MGHDAEAAKAVMRNLAAQPELWGSWLEPDWRLIWGTLQNIADSVQPSYLYEKTAQPLPDTRVGRFTQ